MNNPQPIEDPGEGSVSEDRAYCPDCEYTEMESVVPFADGFHAFVV